MAAKVGDTIIWSSDASAYKYPGDPLVEPRMSVRDLPREWVKIEPNEEGVIVAIDKTMYGGSSTVIVKTKLGEYAVVYGRFPYKRKK